MHLSAFHQEFRFSSYDQNYFSVYEHFENENVESRKDIAYFNTGFEVMQCTNPTLSNCKHTESFHTHIVNKSSAMLAENDSIVLSWT